MIINHHILKQHDVLFHKNTFFINDPHDNINNFVSDFKITDNVIVKHFNMLGNVEIVENLFVTDSLHFCFSHALVECAFRILWSLYDIQSFIKDTVNIPVCIRKREICNHKHLYSPIIDDNAKKYKGVWHEIMNLVSDNYFFEYLIDSKTTLLIKNCYFFTLNNTWQRSPWNCTEYYNHQRTVYLKDVLFSDTEIYYHLRRFVKKAKDRYNISHSAINNNVIIIERKHNRFFDEVILNNIISCIQNNNSLSFKGVKMLEDLSLQEQMKLFSENRIFIFRHGSALANLLWVPDKSIIFELDTEPNRKMIVPRIAKVTNSKVYSMNYQNVNYEMFRYLIIND